MMPSGLIAHEATLLQSLEVALGLALRTPDGVAKPEVVLWPDPDREWEPLLSRLQAMLPQLYVLGDFAPENRTGPAIWLRCIVDRTLPDVAPPEDVVPIFYLPGVARQVLRSAPDCPESYQPLVELQYRGAVWHQRNGRDWTVDAFMVSADALGLDIAQDALTREAMRRALPEVAEMPLAGLRGRRLDAEDFDSLLVTDPTRDLLRWMTDEERFRGEMGSRWQAFCNKAKSDFGFDPEKQSPADAAGELAKGNEQWEGVWQRFKEAPRLYPSLPSLLREQSAAQLGLLDQERTPLSNDQGEEQLRQALTAVAGLPQAKAIAKVQALEAEHGQRRQWVWAALDASPLAQALEPLARLAGHAAHSSAGPTLQALIDAYVAGGWQCDRAGIEAIAACRSAQDRPVVHGAVKALYEPWLDRSARQFQEKLLADEQAARQLVKGMQPESETCVLFVDGLRFDVAGMLQQQLESGGHQVKRKHRLAPLPTVTATAKPFATTVSGLLEAAESADDFNPRFTDGGQAVNAQRLRDAMSAQGVEVLAQEDAQVPAGGGNSAWAEAGKLDELGHKLGVGLAGQIATELETLVARIDQLLAGGWRRVRIVTDHGWLLLPGGLPKVDLPPSTVETKWARCAAVSGESQPAVPVYGWHWNPNSRIACPPGIGSFIAGTEYAHGGISPQECIVPELIVERGGPAILASISGIVWRGMACRVSVNTTTPNLKVDLRQNWRQPESSIAASAKQLSSTFDARLVVKDDSYEGSAATLVVFDAQGNVLDRKATTVGETE